MLRSHYCVLSIGGYEQIVSENPRTVQEQEAVWKNDDVHNIKNGRMLGEMDNGRGDLVAREFNDTSSKHAHGVRLKKKKKRII